METLRERCAQDARNEADWRCDICEEPYLDGGMIDWIDDGGHPRESHQECYRDQMDFKAELYKEDLQGIF